MATKLLRVWYGGEEITKYCDMTLGFDQMMLPGREDTTVSPGNRVGALLQQAHWGSRTITTPFIIAGGDLTSKAKEMSRILYSDEVKKLSFSDKSDRYWNAIPEGGIEIPYDEVDSIQGTIKWICYDPHAHSTTEDKFTFDEAASIQTVVADLKNKVIGNMTVPHTVYKKFEPTTVAVSKPNEYTDEISQAEYSQIGSRDNNPAELISKSVQNFATGPTSSDKHNGEWGSVDSVTFKGDEFTIRGWHATNESTHMPYRCIILTDDAWANEFIRVSVKPTPRPDVKKYLPNIANSEMSGFEATIKYDPSIGKRGRIGVHFRLSDSENGEGHWIDYTAFIQVGDWWRQTEPHYLVKADVIQALEQNQPGFWNRYGIHDRAKQLEWIKENFVSAKVECFVSGSSPLGNNAVMKFWDGSTNWIGNQSSSRTDLAQLQYNYKTADEFLAIVDNLGYIYANIYPEYVSASAISGDSRITLDYFDLQLRVELPSSNNIVINNDGPLPTPIRFDIVNNGQNGFIGIENDRNENILIGSATQLDTTEKKQSETLFKLNTSKYDISDFKLNGGVIANNEDGRQIGNFDLIGQVDGHLWAARNMNFKSFGPSLENGRGWHGPSLHRDFGPDSNGAIGSDNFYCHSYFSMRSGIQNEGLQSVTLNGEDAEHIVTVQMWRGAGFNTELDIILGKSNKVIYKDGSSTRWNQFRGNIDITRSGNVYTIVVEDIESGTGSRQTITYTDAESAKIKCTGWTYWKAVYGDYNNIVAMDPHDLLFRKDNVDKIVDVPNTFAGGDKITITGDDGKVVTRKNGGIFLTMQDIESKPILAYPGDNIISFAYSDYAQKPSVDAYIRKRYL